LCGDPGAARRASEALFVTHVRHGAFVCLDVGRRERILAAGHDVLRTHRQLPAPRRAPGKAKAETLPLVAGLAIHFHHAADDIGAEGAISATDAQRLAVPALGQARGICDRYQARARERARDGNVGLRADLLLAEDLQVVLFDATTAGDGRTGRRFGREP